MRIQTAQFLQIVDGRVFEMDRYSLGSCGMVEGLFEVDDLLESELNGSFDIC
jgi:hypothetical protein